MKAFGEFLTWYCS